MTLADTTPVNSAHRAERILAAWATGDEPLLHQELRNNQEFPGAAAQGLEEERLELLMAVSRGMLQAPRPLVSARQDPAVRRCLDLLAHLAQAPSGVAATALP